MRKFLREPGGAELYPAVEILWLRGHDPEMEVRSCTGQPPSSSRGSVEPVKKVSLARFNTQELHVLMQCNGLTATKTSRWAVLPEELADKCASLPPEPEWTRSHFFGAVVLLLIPAVPLLRCLGVCRGCGAAAKLKRDDGAVPAECCGAQHPAHHHEV